jgi:hypothetical protein
MVVVEVVDLPFGISHAFWRQEPWPGVNARVGEHNVDAAVAIGDAFEGLGHAHSVGHVHKLTPNIAAGPALRLDHPIKFRLIEVECADSRTVLGQHFHVGVPDSARAASDDDRFASHVEHFLQGHGASCRSRAAAYCQMNMSLLISTPLASQ